MSTESETSLYFTLRLTDGLTDGLTDEERDHRRVFVVFVVVVCHL